MWSPRSSLASKALLAASALAGLVSAIGQQPIITFTNGSDTLQIAGGRISDGQILVSPNDYWGVIRAAGDLALDFGRVTGTNYTLSNGVNGSSPASYAFAPVNNMNNTFYTTSPTQYFTGPAYKDLAPSKVVIIAGTIGHSQVVDGLISSGKLSVSEVRGEWEAYVAQRVKSPIDGCAEALVIAGSDPRGTIYGIYDISEQIGVSPWYFWADVPTKQNKNIYVLPQRKVQGPPSVKYRGIFLNDEQPGLTNWIATNWPDTPYGPGYGHEFYSLVFELLLRLKANYLWPAIWATIFAVDDPLNQPRADAYEIVMGSSHTEPLMRAQNEFGKFYQGPWAYNLNNATIDEYFRYGVQRAKPYARNSLWTMGMRGTGDTAIEGLGIDHIVTMLQTLVANQQRIISEGLGVNISTVPQMWCLYKEVQSYIMQGLQVPPDVTLLWADDNWGNIRRLPLKNETSRPGGAGVYYHFDYVGDPRNYKWINTIQLEKTEEQMQLAYQRGADRIWIVNVGDLKPVEIPINHFLDMAYDAKKWTIGTTAEWLHGWATREFGPEHADNITDIMTKYGMYAARRKFELVEPQTYSQINYNEANAVLEQWAILREEAEAVYDSLKDEYKPAFFQMILHPITGGEILYKIQIGAGRNMLYSGQKRNSANEVINQALGWFHDDANLTEQYHALLGRKWDHMMDQTHLGYDGYWQQPMRNTLPAMVYVQTTVPSVAGHIGVGVEGSNATVQGDDKYHPNTVGTLSVPPMDPYGPVTRYFEVFSRGTNSCVWNAEPAQPFVKLSQYNGTVGPNGGPDTRVFISIDWANAPPAPNTTTVNINVTTPCRGLDKYGFPGQMVIVPVTNRKVPSNFTKGYVESDGHVAIEGIHYSAIVPPATSSPDNAGVTYHTYKNYGRISGGVGLWPLNTEKLTVETAPALEYNMYLFTNTTAANVTLHISPAHNYLSDYNPLEYAISLFPTGSAPTEPPTLVRPVGATVGANMPAAWGHAVADSVWGLTSGNQTTTRHNVPREGAYTLRIQALLSGIIVQKVVVDLGGVRPSYFGPPESFYIDAENPAIANTIGVYNGTSFHNTRGALGGVGDGNATRIEKSAAVGTRSWMSLGLFVAFAAAALNML